MATTASAHASINAEPMEIWSRPLELGYTVIGMGEGTYQHNSSEKPVGGQASFFLGSDPSVKLSPGAKIAAFNAIMEAGADGIYVTMVKEKEKESQVSPDSFSTVTVKSYWVKGLLLKLEAYGAVCQGRSDKARFGKCSCRMKKGDKTVGCAKKTGCPKRKKHHTSPEKTIKPLIEHSGSEMNDNGNDND